MWASDLQARSAPYAPTARAVLLSGLVVAMTLVGAGCSEPTPEAEGAGAGQQLEPGRAYSPPKEWEDHPIFAIDRDEMRKRIEAARAGKPLPPDPNDANYRGPVIGGGIIDGAFSPPATLDPAAVPNPYESVGLGVSMRRPDDWVWLPMTSRPDFADHAERLPDDPMVPADWHAPIVTPIIATAPVPDPVRGRDPIVELFIRPSLNAVIQYRPEHCTKYALSILEHFAGARTRDYDNVDSTMAPTPAGLGGLDGGVTRIAYDVTQPDGSTLRASETRWLARRGRSSFSLHVTTASGDDPALEQIIEAIRDSIRIDP